jgi:hypothetical protein
MLNPRRIADQVLRLSQQLSLAFGYLSRKVQALSWDPETTVAPAFGVSASYNAVAAV